ncbi:MULTISPECIES: ATP synthase F1 subunit gamma [Candidatus Ichthyocystis]|uniref:ATP synthase gamma chain n=1 Tax=Candidatus Ichthyocystis hellenicum TaxID=1561003 RepID=A0A0S4M002_9BURK|nr:MULTISPECIES: ATP synthase F1 subunit gamma [Ichthyocystis]CUT17127.1 ATP synthase subunit gamma [Candidatus Ichthyocystis hellenicum]
MSSAKAIRGKIKSVTNTRKITTAMEMVAASKMRKAQEEMMSMRPYANKVRCLAGHLLSANTDYCHPYVFGNQADSRNVGFVVVSTDKGLCGGLNSSLFRYFLKCTEDETLDISSNFRVATIGDRGYGFFRRMRVDVVAHVSLSEYKDKFSRILGVTKSMLQLFDKNEISRLYILFNRFENTMKQVPTLEQLLPIKSVNEQNDGVFSSSKVNYICEPNERELIDLLLDRYVENLVCEYIAEHNSSEQSARMVAMKAASDNAGEFIDHLKIEYNKSRQAAITKELSEIVSGSSVV